jgi:hypothetical protein
MKVADIFTNKKGNDVYNKMHDASVYDAPKKYVLTTMLYTR